MRRFSAGQLGQHPVEPVQRLSDLLQKEHAPIERGFEWGAQKRRDQRQVSAECRPPRTSRADHRRLRKTEEPLADEPSVEQSAELTLGMLEPMVSYMEERWRAGRILLACAAGLAIWMAPMAANTTSLDNTYGAASSP